MKYILIFLSFITVTYAEPNWTMIKYSTPLSYCVDFDYLEEDVLTAKVIRSGLCTLRYYYDLFSPDGTFQARAINRVLSLGLLCPSQMEFDIYDETNTNVGYISGRFWTNGRAKFGFANAGGKETGSALLNSDCDQAIFSILSPTNTLVATLNGALSGDLSKWELDAHRPLDIDSRALKIFTAFVADFHYSFIRKKEEIHHHYHSDSSKHD